MCLAVDRLLLSSEVECNVRCWKCTTTFVRKGGFLLRQGCCARSGSKCGRSGSSYYSVGSSAGDCKNIGLEKVR